MNLARSFIGLHIWKADSYIKLLSLSLDNEIHSKYPNIQPSQVSVFEVRHGGRWERGRKHYAQHNIIILLYTCPAYTLNNVFVQWFKVLNTVIIYLHVNIIQRERNMGKWDNEKEITTVFLKISK